MVLGVYAPSALFHSTVLWVQHLQSNVTVLKALAPFVPIHCITVLSAAALCAKLPGFGCLAIASPVPSQRRLPSCSFLNDTALAIPYAIQAGLGEYGRHGLLIHPEYAHVCGSGNSGQTCPCTTTNQRRSAWLTSASFATDAHRPVPLKQSPTALDINQYRIQPVLQPSPTFGVVTQLALAALQAAALTLKG